MARWWKIAIAIAVMLPLLALGAGVGFIAKTFGWPTARKFLSGTFRGTRSRPLTAHTFERTPARLERGRYLVSSLTNCFKCHTQHEPGREPRPEKMGAGAVETLPGLGLQITFPNLTPDAETGAGSWTDDMFARAIREGIGHDGRPLVPIMPYEDFRYMSDEDLAAVVVYLRSIPAVYNPLPQMKLPLLFKLLTKGFPEPLTGAVSSVDSVDSIRHGEYLTQISGCEDCHMATDLEGKKYPYGGGQIIEADTGKVAAANLTPDPSGIPYYSDDTFIQTMRTGRVGGVRELSATMPWRYYGKLNDDDLKMIFAYLRTQKAVSHHVDNSEPPTYCKFCGKTHGGGSLNP
jgi:mono/diheme cytochrome c family protein